MEQKWLVETGEDNCFSFADQPEIALLWLRPTNSEPVP